MDSKKRVKKPKAAAKSLDEKMATDPEFAALIAADDAAWAKDNPAPPVGTAYDPEEHCPDRLRAWGLGVSYEDVERPILVLMAREPHGPR